MLNIHSTQRGDQEILELEGELTIYAAAEAKADLAARLEANPALALDLAQVTDLDTAGVQLLFWLKREARERGQGLPLLHHSPAVLEVFDLLKLTALFGDPILIAPSAS